MPVKRIKIEVQDEEGNKLTFSFNGGVTRNKVLQLLDFIELVGGVTSTQPEKIEELANLSKFEKLQLVVKNRFPVGWFTSQEALIAYEDTLNTPIGLSTISTYLVRLTNQGFLSRSGSRVNRRYKIKRRSLLREKQKIQP